MGGVNVKKQTIVGINTRIYRQKIVTLHDAKSGFANPHKFCMTQMTVCEKNFEKGEETPLPTSHNIIYKE